MKPRYTGIQVVIGLICTWDVIYIYIYIYISVCVCVCVCMNVCVNVYV